MEEFFTRYSHLSEKIFEYLDDESLLRCRSVSKTWKNYLDMQRFPWIRMIFRHKLNVQHEKAWNIIHKIQSHNLKDLAFIVRKFYAYCPWRKEDEQTPLHFAVRSGKMSVFLEVFELSQDKNPRDARGLTPMHFAALHGYFQIIEILILHQTLDKNPSNETGDTPLHYAAKRGHLDVCKLIMKDLVDKNPHGDKGQTPLHYASENGHFEMCQFFLSVIEDKNPSAENGMSPMWIALKEDNLPLFKLIVNNLEEKNPLGTPAYVTTVKNTPLHIAAWHGKIEFVRFLVDQISEKNPFNEEGTTPLHKAVIHKRFDVIKLLMEKVSDKNPLSREGNSLLHHASANQSWEIYEYLLQFNADQNPQNNSGHTPLHNAAKYGHLSMCKMITNLDLPDKNPPDNNGDTPMHYAARNKLKVFEFFMPIAEEKGDVNPPNKAELRPLHLAALTGSLQICQLIVGKITLEEAEAKNSEGFNALHFAALGGHLEMTKYFLSIFKEKCPKTKFLATPLHLAAQNGHILVAQELLAAGNDLSPNKHGDSPKDLALKYRHIAVCKLLMEYPGFQNN